MSDSESLNKSDKPENLVKVSSPALSALDKLYLRAYLNTLSHVEAHKVVAPENKQHHANNLYSRKESIKFHIALALQSQSEVLNLSPNKVLERLLKEATREGAGSNHNARVNALLILGKHLGMFTEKKEVAALPIINIISYTDVNTSNKELPTVTVEANVLPVIESSLENVPLAPTYDDYIEEVV